MPGSLFGDCALPSFFPVVAMRKMRKNVIIKFTTVSVV